MDNNVELLKEKAKKLLGSVSFGIFNGEDEILKILIQKEKGLELNMAGLKYGLPYAHPHKDILKRYKELGGEIITVGADGHKPEHIAYDFHKVSDILKECGFTYYTEFNKRKPDFCKLV